MNTFGFQFFIFIITDIVFGYILYRIGRKFVKIPAWHYFIPYFNFIPILKIANMSIWFALLFGIYGILGIYINFLTTKYGYVIYRFHIWYADLYLILVIICLIIFAIITGRIARKLKKSFWLNAIFSWTGIPLLIFAFGKAMPISDDTNNKENKNQPDDFFDIKYTIKFETGEFAGNSLEVPKDGLIIGRDSSLVNIIVDSPQISAKHLRIYPSNNALIVEDLGSSNGTFMLEGTTSSKIDGYKLLSSQKLIESDISFYLGDTEVMKFKIEVN